MLNVGCMVQSVGLGADAYHYVYAESKCMGGGVLDISVRSIAAVWFRLKLDAWRVHF